MRLELALLGHLFNVAMREWGLGLTYNPLQSVRRPSPGAGRDRRLQGDETSRLLAAADAFSNPMVGWIVRLALETAGMRASEIRSLRSLGSCRRFRDWYKRHHKWAGRQRSIRAYTVKIHSRTSRSRSKCHAVGIMWPLPWDHLPAIATFDAFAWSLLRPGQRM